MGISAYGVIMLAISLETPVYQAPYPPFGVAASSFIALTCYLYSLGIYSSAISVSEEGRVVALTKKHQDSIEEETGVESSLTEDDMKEYLQQVIEELKKTKKSPSTGAG